MKTVKVKAFLSIGLAVRQEEVIVIEVEDAYTPQQVEETIDMEVKEWMYGYLDYGWEEVAP